MSPRVVIGAPLHARAEHLPAALDSLLGQSHQDLAVVAIDDASPDRTPEVLADYAGRDARLWWRRNSERVGMAANWRLAFELAVERHPEAEYFAWASDHDLWGRRWLEALTAELDRHPEAVLAYPHSAVIDGEGRQLRGPWSFDTARREGPGSRLCAAAWGMRAGDMVYGLFRVEPVRRAGVFRPVLWPDRLLLSSPRRARSARCRGCSGGGASLPLPASVRPPRASAGRCTRASRRRSHACPGGPGTWSRSPGARSASRSGSAGRGSPSPAATRPSCRRSSSGVGCCVPATGWLER
jgi:glycosyltransferase involved in cell wall biosynthesis